MMRILLVCIFTTASALCYSAYANYSRIIFSLEDISSPILSVSNMRVKLAGLQTLHLEIYIDKITVQEETWRNLTLVCDNFKLTRRLVSCTNGTVHLSNLSSLNVSLSFIPDKKFLEIEINPIINESVKFILQWDTNAWRGELDIKNGQVLHIAKWLPNLASLPLPTKGKVNGFVKFNGNAEEVTKIVAELLIDALAFSDNSGLHAGENVSVEINVNAKFMPRNKQWQWQGKFAWLNGEVFWQPLYLTGKGHHLSLEGTLNTENIRLLNGDLQFTDVGRVSFSGELDRLSNDWTDFYLYVNKLDLHVLYDQILQPFLAETVFSEIEVDGYAGFTWHYRNGLNKLLIFDLYDSSVIDQRERFAFERINAHIPWNSEQVTIADISMLNGEILSIPLGEVRVPLEISKDELRIPQLVLPVLDSQLKLEDFKASWQDDDWSWQFSGEFLPISMQTLTEALQTQLMHGTLSGVIPKISYSQSVVTVDGTLLFNIFDGTVIANNLKLVEPLGLAPRLEVDLEMRNLDLDLLTQTFSFGNMQGLVDMNVRNLELVNWLPVKFDAHLFSSPGDYSRQISQAAVQNISALGGSGAVAAIQRSFLRFFKSFMYSEIGWRCLLSDNICNMGGIESESYQPELSNYTLVKGGGVPAITVIGHNRSVDWPVLIDRLQRITNGQGPIVQ